MKVTIEELKKRLESGPVKLVCDDGYFNHEYRSFVVSHIEGDRPCGTDHDGDNSRVREEYLKHMAFAEPEVKAYRLWELEEDEIYTDGVYPKVIFDCDIYKFQDKDGKWESITFTKNWRDTVFTKVKKKKVTKTVDLWVVYDTDRGAAVTGTGNDPERLKGLCLRSCEKLIKLTGTYETEEEI